MAANLNENQSSKNKIPPASFVKLAMKNMVRKGRQSLIHLGLTATGFLGFILIVAWFARPNIPH